MQNSKLNGKFADCIKTTHKMTIHQMQPNPFRQTNAFAMNYAVPFGLWWIAGFLCFVYSMRVPPLSIVFYFVFASTPVIGYMLLCRFRNRVCGGGIAFGRGYLFSLLIYFYAALLLAFVCYLYFQFLDHGAFVSGYLDAIDSPEVRRAFEQESMRRLTGGTGIADLRHALEAIQTVSPVVYAANILDINIFLGLVLSVPAALLAARRRPGRNKQQ